MTPMMKAALPSELRSGFGGLDSETVAMELPLKLA
jgi:hypothetical protein